MISNDRIFGGRSARAALVYVFFAAAALSINGCPGLPGAQDTPKSVQVRFATFDIGSNDCEDIFSYGDFTATMTVTVQPSNEEVFTVTRTAELGSASFQADVQSIDFDEVADFELEAGESFDVEIRITEDDPIDSLEPQPWEESESFDFLTVASESFSFTNGPDCFSDDRFDITVTVSQ